ncbi:glycoside hydrolase family 30 beta sandwich domain-containing protein [Mucilaginibacter sp. cycad4]|uniref:glycoside hydrolase family 30 protein n=1 Tax=Mucilaginibacter sp. cycad4 TaxID=3342096 RepID=UPI002AABA281|nr:glycoside hydrolase family 30 beta sandwich domain-containing protein [Mucilaginibacter gossypii]WPU98963.1 glycoside hydrolase family 30 beta sandwich domain-containing protein [Mucilaginibacter gossypii]
MNTQIKPILLGAMLLAPAAAIHAQTKASLWLTKADRSVLFEQQKGPLAFKTSDAGGTTITVDDKEHYQPIDGFGFALTGGSAMHIIRMSADSRAALLKNLFAVTGNDIGISYLRLSIGASDLNEKVFSYDDMPKGQTDPTLKHFDLGPDKADVIPVMKQILAINPAIKILGSPWSPPAWMKTNNDTRGGRLKPDCYPVYAQYLVKYIQGMKANGINIDAITIQNEPLHPGNNPSLLMVAPDEADFIKNNLGPAFKAAGIKTKIIVYDHNADRPDYPISILNDPAARKYVDGSGFHLYGGDISALTDVHNAHPDKNIYFTEQMTVEPENQSTINIAWPVKSLIIGATRNWSRNVLEWNLAADPEYKPYTDRGGCPSCQGAVTIDKNEVKKNIAYYSVAHASKFVRPGSVRIASNNMDTLPNVAFKTPDGKKVLIVANTGDSAQDFNIKYQGKILAVKLDKGSVGTYIW